MKIGSEFNSKFFETIETHKNNNFVTVYAADGKKTKKTFYEFGKDVIRVRDLIIESTPHGGIVCTQSTNNYPHLCYILGILLAGRRLCLLNPTENSEDTQKKLSLLNEPYSRVTVTDIEPRAVDIKPLDILRNLNDDFIYIFTSGTTGESKIVRQTEHGTLSNLRALITHHELDKNKSVIATPLPVFHVNALHFSFFTSFFSGSELVLFEKFDPMLLIKAFESESVEIVSLVPHILASLLNFESKISRIKKKTFKYFVSAAVGLPIDVFRQWSQLGYKVVQGFGMSEGINFTLKMPVNLSIADMLEIANLHSRPSVGVPILETEAAIFSNDELVLPDKETGEIGIRGNNLMPGYKNQAKVKTNSSGYFLTGDVGFSDTYKGVKYFYISSRVKEIAKPNGIMVSLPNFDEKLKNILNPKDDIMSFIVENSSAVEGLGIALKGVWTEAEVFSVLETIKTLPPHEIPKLIVTTELELRTASGKLKRGLGLQLVLQYIRKNIGGIDWYHQSKA